MFDPNECHKTTTIAPDPAARLEPAQRLLT
jgi:hypothetical protein